MVFRPTHPRLVPAAFLLGALAGGVMPARAQDPAWLGVPCAGPLGGYAVGHTGFAAELARLAELTGEAPRRSRGLVRHSEVVGESISCRPQLDRDATVVLEPATLHLVHNSGYASDRNNGAMWSGRGLSSMVRAGASLKWQGLRLSVVPEFVHHANEDFTTRAAATQRHELAHPLYADIDWYQRPGEDGDYRVTWGQSSLSFARWGASAGVSTENLWNGPATRYPIILSNSAEGTPHLFIGTERAPDVWIGRLDARLIWARTEESSWFDADDSNDWSNLVGWSVGLRPRGLDWLEIGFARTYKYRARSDYDLDLEPVTSFLVPAGANRDGDELASLTFRAVMIEHGLEFYGEWARTDRFLNVENDLLTEPDHSQGYVIGLQKITTLGRGALRISGELVHLQEKSEDRVRGAGRPLNVFYTNGQLQQGHTHEGQLLGAWVGPGADAQYLELGYMSPSSGYLALFGERVRRNETRAIDMRDIFPFTHDVELIGGMRGAFIMGESLIDASVAYHYEINRLFFEEESSNLRFELSVTSY